MTPQSENFDHLLDQALQSYVSAEPRLGIEDRILAHVAAQSAPRQLPGLLNHGLLWTGLAAVCLAIASMLFFSTRQAPQKKQEISRSIPSSRSIPAPHPAIPPSRTPDIERAAVQRPHRSTSPKYGRPQLTQQDRVLVKFVALHHQDALDFARQQQTPDRPISDQPIASTPLPIDPIVSQPIVIAPIAMDSKDKASF